MIELRHIQLFITTAEHLHFRHAAASAGVSVGKLSQTIARLESDIGVDLFDRTEQAVALTPAGRVFLGEARRLIVQTEQSLATVQDVRKQAEATVRVGYYPGLALPSIEQRILPFATVTEDVGVSLTDGSPAELADQLSAGDVDIIISSSSSQRRHFATHQLTTTALCVVMHREHPCADQPVIALSQLEHEPLVLLSRLTDPVLFDLFVRACHEVGFDPKPSRIVSRAEIVLPSVGMGLGVGVATESVTAAWSSLRTRAVPLSVPIEFPVVAMRRTKERDPASQSATDRLWRHLNEPAT